MTEETKKEPETKTDVLRWATLLYEIGSEMKIKTEEVFASSMLLSLALTMLDECEKKDLEDLRSQEANAEKITDEVRGLVELIRNPNEKL